MKTPIVIGSRGSKLALTQANLVKAQLATLYPTLQVRIEIIRTSGDVKTDPLSVIGGKGVFTKELEEALLDRRIDLAVHSLKDLLTINPEGLTISAICEREDARDALVIRGDLLKFFSSLSTLPKDSIIGTSSTRRVAQLRHIRDELIVKDIRGNVDTRLKKLDSGEYHAVILAAAGLRRLGLEERISVLLRPQQMLPAPGQGALAIQTRADDSETISCATPLNHRATRQACEAERAFLRALGGGCQLPIAAYASVHENHLNLEGLVADPDGNQVLRDRISGSPDKAEQLGSALANRLLQRGANQLLSLESSL
ncbi:MAG: hydroxymethylbilane synthase [Pyrinomonadaceae bacterium]